MKKNEGDDEEDDEEEGAGKGKGKKKKTSKSMYNLDTCLFCCFFLSFLWYSFKIKIPDSITIWMR